MRFLFVAFIVAGTLGFLGCKANQKPCITAVSLNRDCHWGQEAGIPFYLPKPLLIVSKNFRYIEEAKVGLTDSAPIPSGFDDQSKYADVNARTNFNFDDGDGSGGTQSAGISGDAAKSGQHLFSQNGAPITPLQSPSDGLGPDTFFTYHIVFVPDLTQKYGLKIRGGPGEVRAAMNLVNGWQYTGMGPYYSKDSSSAQNILSGGISTRLGGQAAQDVLSSVADLAKAFPATQSGGMLSMSDPRIQQLSSTIEQLPMHAEPLHIPNYAEIHVYEPSLGPDGMMTWNEIANCSFDRAYLGVKKPVALPQPMSVVPLVAPITDTTGAQNQSMGFMNTNSDAVTQSAIAAVFGVNPSSPAIQQTGGLQSGAIGSTPAAGGVNQVNVSCPADCQEKCCRPNRTINLINLAGRRNRDNSKIQRKIVSVTPTPVVTSQLPANQNTTDRIRNQNLGSSGNGAGAGTVLGPGLQSGQISGGQQPSTNGAVFNNANLNQPILNQPTVIQPQLEPLPPQGG